MTTSNSSISPSTLRIGTRKSPLATWQAEHVASLLRSYGFSVELVPITTSGDVLQGSLTQSGGVGLFTKEIQRALLDNRCDIAVHSLKDLPTEPVDGLCLAAVPEREDPSDCLVAREHFYLESLPSNSVVGTGSPRRRAQLLQARSDLKLADIRGNVDTRLKKLANGEFDAIILALAGLRRLGLEHVVTQRLSWEIMLPAVGQAALGLETRFDDSATIEAVRMLDHPTSHLAVFCEREVLRTLKAGCLAPVAVHAQCLDRELFMTCRVFSSDYKQLVVAEHRISAERPLALDRALGERLVAEIMKQLRLRGAELLISDARKSG
jgi:hydroxymethylbilane synthase